jgi:hypothetical protein
MADTSRLGIRITRIDEIYCQALEQREDERPTILNLLNSQGFCDLEKAQENV